VEADLPVNPSFSIPGEELQVSTSRSGGPGGQHVNTTDSRVTIRWNVMSSPALSEDARARILLKLGSRLTREGEVMVSASDDRSQLVNRGLARDRLAALLRQALLVPRSRRPTRPSRGSKERRIAAKKLRGARLRDRGAGHE
jgi:ribosome-associated protein